MGLSGKGIYLWQIKATLGGDPTVIANKASYANLTHVLIKVADGKYGYNFSGNTDLVPGVVAALRAKGIQPWGWQYVYGNDPIVEARKAIDRVKRLGLVGFVVNAEGQFKAKGMDKVARIYMKELRKGIPGIPVGLSTYRYPSVHYPFPFSAFLEYCDLNLPQIYWIKSVNPAQQLQKSYDEYKAIKPWRPFVPTGAAFGYGNWTATPAQIVEFLTKARAMNLPGANFWEMASARDNGGSLWKAIKGYNWATGTAPVVQPDPAPAPISSSPTPDIYTRLINAMNSRNPKNPASLYEKMTGKVFAGNQKYKGRAAIEDWYTKLFNKIMPKATFTLRSWSWKGYVFKFNWKAIAGGKTWLGSDTLYMSTANPKLINEHYTTMPSSKSIDAEDVAESEPGPIPV